MIGRARKKALAIGVFSVVVSVMCGLIATRLLITNDDEFQTSFFFLVKTTSVTSFPVVTSLLNDLNIVNSELGRIGQSAALISDFISMFWINGSVMMKVQTEKGSTASLEFLGMIVESL
ncbi:hypothetical protein ACFE04_024582 [Oxalis oulophora]